MPRHRKKHFLVVAFTLLVMVIGFEHAYAVIPSGRLNIGYGLINFSPDYHEPYSSAQIANWAKTTNDFLVANSFGKIEKAETWIFGCQGGSYCDEKEYYTINAANPDYDPDGRCDLDQWADHFDANVPAADAWNSLDVHVYVFDGRRTSCDWKGIAHGYRRIFINAPIEIQGGSTHAREFQRATAHELGHLFGVDHAGNAVFSHGMLHREYGDFYDIMGAFSFIHSSDYMKSLLGWKGATTLPGSGFISFIESANNASTPAYKVEVNDRVAMFVEFRQHREFDNERNEHLNRVSVRLGPADEGKRPVEYGPKAAIETLFMSVIDEGQSQCWEGKCIKVRSILSNGAYVRVCNGECPPPQAHTSGPSSVSPGDEVTISATTEKPFATARWSCSPGCGGATHSVIAEAHKQSILANIKGIWNRLIRKAEAAYAVPSFSFTPSAQGTYTVTLDINFQDGTMEQIIHSVCVWCDLPDDRELYIAPASTGGCNPGRLINSVKRTSSPEESGLEGKQLTHVRCTNMGDTKYNGGSYMRSAPDGATTNCDPGHFITGFHRTGSGRTSDIKCQPFQGVDGHEGATLLGVGFSFRSCPAGSYVMGVRREGPSKAVSFINCAKPSSAYVASGSCNKYEDNRQNKCFYDGIALDATKVLRHEASSVSGEVAAHTLIDRDWGEGEIINGRTDRVSYSNYARVNFKPGFYTFHTLSDDGVRLTVEGIGKVIENWTNHGETQNNSTRYYLEGHYNVLTEWYDDTRAARLKVWWDYEEPGPQSGSPTVAGNQPAICNAAWQPVPGDFISDGKISALWDPPGIDTANIGMLWVVAPRAKGGVGVQFYSADLNGWNSSGWHTLLDAKEKFDLYVSRDSFVTKLDAEGVRGEETIHVHARKLADKSKALYNAWKGVKEVASEGSIDIGSSWRGWEEIGAPNVPYGSPDRVLVGGVEWQFTVFEAPRLGRVYYKCGPAGTL